MRDGSTETRQEVEECPDCGGPWDLRADPTACPHCGLSTEDLEAAAAFFSERDDERREDLE